MAFTWLRQTWGIHSEVGHNQVQIFKNIYFKMKIFLFHVHLWNCAYICKEYLTWLDPFVILYNLSIIVLHRVSSCQWQPCYMLHKFRVRYLNLLLKSYYFWPEFIYFLWIKNTAVFPVVTETQSLVSDMNPLHQYVLYTNHHQDHHNLHHVLHYWASSQQNWHWYRISSGSVLCRYKYQLQSKRTGWALTKKMDAYKEVVWTQELYSDIL